MSRKKTGRPSKVLEYGPRICGWVSKGAPETIACDAVGIARSTMSEWKRKGEQDPDSDYGRFRQALMRARGERDASLCERLLNSQDDRTIRWYLECRRREEFGKHQVQEVQVRDTRKPTLEEAEKASSELRLVGGDEK